MFENLFRLVRMIGWDRISHAPIKLYRFRRDHLVGSLHRVAGFLPWYHQEDYLRFVEDWQNLCSRQTRGKVVLEIGCGQGEEAERFLRMHGASIVIASDISPEMVEAAKLRDSRIIPLVADARSLPIRSGGVDVVYCSTLYHHIEEEERVKVLAESRRVSREVVLLLDLFGFSNRLFDLLYALYYRVIDGSARRPTLEQWRQFLAHHILAELHMPTDALAYRFCFYVVRSEANDSERAT